jgi:hypothetical protein
MLLETSVTDAGEESGASIGGKAGSKGVGGQDGAGGVPKVGGEYFDLTSSEGPPVALASDLIVGTCDRTPPISDCNSC